MGAFYKTVITDSFMILLFNCDLRSVSVETRNSFESRHFLSQSGWRLRGNIFYIKGLTVALFYFTGNTVYAVPIRMKTVKTELVATNQINSNTGA